VSHQKVQQKINETTATTITESLNDFNRSGFSNTLCLSYNMLSPEIKISLV